MHIHHQPSEQRHPEEQPLRAPPQGCGCAQPPPWYELPEFRALAEVRRAFVKGGIPLAVARASEASARLAVFWTLYELGHALTEIERRTRAGSPCWASVRATEIRPGRITLDITIEPAEP